MTFLHRLKSGVALAATLTATSVWADTKVDVAYLPLLGSAQLFVMEEEGWAKEAGLEFEMTQFSSGAAINQALASGDFDVAVMALAPVIVARASGIDLTVIAALHDVNSHAYIGAGKWTETYAAAASPAEAFKTFHEETGSPVKISTLPKGTLPDTAVKFYLHTAGVAQEDYEIINQGSDQVLQSMLAGASDSVSLAEPLMTIISDRLPEAKIIAGGADLMPGHPGFVFAVRESFIAENPDAAKSLAGMVKKATLLIQKDPERAATSAMKYIGRGLLTKEVMTSAISSPWNPVAYDPKDITDGTMLMQEFQYSIGSQSRIVPIDELFTFGYFDDAAGNN